MALDDGSPDQAPQYPVLWGLPCQPHQPLLEPWGAQGIFLTQGSNPAEQLNRTDTQIHLDFTTEAHEVNWVLTIWTATSQLLLPILKQF